MFKLVDKNGNEILKDKLLWNGTTSGYSGNVTLNQNPFEFKELIFVYERNDKNCFCIAPIINHEKLSDGCAVNAYQTVYFSEMVYTESNKNLFFNSILWSNENNNSTVTLKEIWGRY
ncbi:hypothetical protein [uncultured Thomasclavelia sp.]|uniref:hypothetical protein n=1 Tax=uncultured Thomasclavelia sp. TaxID=3025759 RepID=UPI00262E2CAF|nr:hypothetical protein [uncultured Thomasclavelia sp.]